MVLKWQLYHKLYLWSLIWNLICIPLNYFFSLLYIFYCLFYYRLINFLGYSKGKPVPVLLFKNCHGYTFTFSYPYTLWNQVVIFHTYIYIYIFIHIFPVRRSYRLSKMSQGSWITEDETPYNTPKFCLLGLRCYSVIALCTGLREAYS